ncbi:response regulator [Mucilaginibacter sp.]
MSVNYKTCLLIDDNYIDNFVTRRILESSNFAEKVIVEQSAPDAIDSIRDGVIEPDVIFLDLRMPMMNGFEFLQELDKLNFNKKNSVKIFMLSSSLDPTDVKRSSQNKYISQFIHKPLTQKILQEL